MKQFKKNKLKLLAMLMTLMMIFTMIPATAFATEGDGYEDVPSVKVTLSLSRDAAFMVGEASGEVMAFKEITVPYFDLAKYGLEQYYFVSESYGDDGDGLPGSDLEPGTAEYADGKVTLLHLYIYALEVYYCDIEPEEAGQGYLYDEGLIGTEVFSISGSQGSSFLNQFWGGDCNLNYYVNHEYPLASEGWGATSDQILLRDGDFISLGHFDNWSFYSDPRSIFNYIKADEVVDSVTVSKGDEVTLSLFCAGPNMGTSYDTAQNPITYEPEVFCKPIEEVYSDPSYADVATWNSIGCADENGELVFDTSDLEAGEYLVCLPGQSGEYSDDICSTPGGIKLIVEDDSSGDDEAAAALAQAKEEAKAEIAGYKKAEDYREAQQTELAAAVEAAKAAIDAAENTDAVAAALAEAKTAINEIKTDAQLTEEEEAAAAAALAQAKEEAKAEIAGYKKAEDYREAQQTELAAAVEAAKAAIDKAESIEAVEAAVATAKVEIDKIKTDAQLDKEEADALAKAKEDAKTYIADYKTEKEAGGYGYSSEQLTKLQEVIAKAEAAIDNAESIEAVEEAKAAAIAEMDTIKTLKEEVSDLTAELENAKKENEANKEAFEKKIADLEVALKEADAKDKAAMQEEIESLQAELKAAEEESSAKQEELAGQIEQLQSDLAEAKELTEKQKEELATEIKSLQDALDAAKEDNAANKKALEDQISGLETAIEALQSEKTQLENQIADLNAKLEKAEADNAAAKAELEGKIAELKEALESADAADKAAMQEEIKALQAELKAAEEVSAAKQEELAGQIEQLQKDIADAKTLTEKQKEELSSEITSLKIALDASDAEKQAMQEEIDALKAELEQLKENKQLAAPIGVKAFNNTVTGKNKVSWKAVAGAEEYAVYRSTSKNGAYKKMFTTTGTTYTNTSAKAGTLYYYKVKALTGDKSVDDSKFSAVVKRTCDLKKPVVTAKSKTKNQVKLTWKKVSGAKKYTVYRATSKNGKYTKIATTSKLSYTNKKLKSGKTYYYKVKAIAKNSAANSAFSTVDKCKSR